MKNGAPPAGFLSLKWKALLLTSLVLIGVTAAYTWLNALLLNEHFEHRRAAIQESYARQLQALLDRSGRRLEQLGTVFASSSDVQDLVRSPADERAAATFERLWTSLTIDMGVETVGLFSHQGSPIATRGWDRVGGSAAVSVLVPAVSRDERPRALYDCSSACLQFTAVPVLGTGGRAGALVLGVSPADAVLDFQRVSGTDMGLVAIGPGTTEDAALPARYIPHWRGTVVALSNDRHNIPLLRAAAARYPDPADLGTPRYEHVGDQVFELRMVPLARTAETGRSYVVVIADITEALREIRDDDAPEHHHRPVRSGRRRIAAPCGAMGAPVAPETRGRQPAAPGAGRVRRAPIGDPIPPAPAFLARRGGCLERDRGHAVLAARDPARGVAGARRRAGYRTRLRHQRARNRAGHHPDPDMPGRHQNREPPCPGAVEVFGRRAGGQVHSPS